MCYFLIFLLLLKILLKNLFVFRFQELARDVFKKGDKKAALQWMKKKKRVEEEIAQKDKQYQNLLVMLQQVAQSKQTREIVEIYRESSAAFKAALNRQGLTVDNVIFINFFIKYN